MPELEVSAVVGLQASIDGLAAQMKRRLDRAQQAVDHAPVAAPIHGQSSTGTTGAAVFSCGGPTQGRVWQIRSLAIGASGIAAGIARFYAAGSAPQTTGLQLIGARDTTTFKTFSLRTRFYSTGQFLLHAPQQLWVVVVTATHTVTVGVDGIAEDYDWAAYRAVTVL